MKRITTLAATVCGCIVLAASGVQAQGIAVGARAGTLGLGGEAAVGIGQRLAIRGGVGVIPVTPKGTFSDVDYEVELPSPLMTLGADLYLLPSLRIFGGMLFGAEETNITGDFTGTVNIGGTEYSKSQLGDLTGTVKSATAAPFVGIGFGRHVARGFGLTLDLGVAFMGEADLELEATGPISTNATFQNELEEERREVEQDLRDYTKLFPVLSLGFRFGL